MRPRHKKLAPFVPLDKATMKTPAWRAMSNGARMLYVHLKWHYNRNLANGVYISTRDAADALGSNRDSVQRWFRELQYYGFIVMVSPGHLGVEGMGKAPHYRLTEEFYGDRRPTRDYLNWSGEKFHEQKSPKHYLGKKQNPGPTIGARVAAKVGPVVPATVPNNGSGGRESGAIGNGSGGYESGAISSLTTPLAALSALRAQRQRLDDLSRRLAVFAPTRRGGAGAPEGSAVARPALAPSQHSSEKNGIVQLRRIKLGAA